MMMDRIPISEELIRPQLLTLREFRPFKTSDEYLWAMKEDLSDWLNLLYPELNITPQAFMECLETGVTLCKVIHNATYNLYCITLSGASLVHVKRRITPKTPMHPIY